MPAESSRVRSMNETRNRILDVALDVLGDNPDAAMGDIASAAGVVRRTVYDHFPLRLDLVRTLAERAVTEVAAVLTEVDAPDAEADATWVEFIARLWPVAHRYRVLLALRRGEYGEAIHSLLGPVDELLADLVKRGQDSGVFAQHLPAGILSQLAYGVVFSIADSDPTKGPSGARAATITSLLMLGVPETRAVALVDDRP
ncbi:TetR/AcrR family transcriptional regulator [Streptomyces acidiscabies]|uniref:TetR/AcrR family transcriptional regulator n=1 Tax=Streptomyces acidiscabies TaxID=42234 RepID=A0AAP6BHC9_9ACTN|nr:TetR/AcrR family transcriptional regulator [Streptomyces acidiscabies]MBP5934984.1 TetR/AcrR family transcriptional regulator [Streptomyces sp. LBUM 1476]MBZ3917243.1 TetR/AcrR family transcriptional regulator [Streptomyces acidiscabies]MDX2964768.1 TetR/AcrR family transcriptional regulator [Streptomyces acidiscabies]MDX3023269.1 TetR/AcrR family transcriptional regulator [Streptomyces acidiscabies]MDX3795928.1 TetR/AcrR family transcriptional regulator [Streptomyces acidiscabies]